MIQIVATALVALLSFAALAHAQDRPRSASAVSSGTARPLEPAAEEGTPPTMREPPSLTAGVRIITRPQASARAPQDKSVAPSTSDGAGPPEGAPTARYRFERMGDRFVRLDNQNGEIAVCAQETVGWDCRSVAEHPSTLETEVAELRHAIDDLKALRKQVDELSALRADVQNLKQLSQQIGDLRQSAESGRTELQNEIENLRQDRTEARTLDELRKDVDDLKQLRGEIAGVKNLQTVVDDLKNQIAQLRAPPPPPQTITDERENPPRPPETVPPAGASSGGAHLSPRETIDRAAAFISDTWRRLVEMISHLQKEAMRRS